MIYPMDASQPFSLDTFQQKIYVQKAHGNGHWSYILAQQHGLPLTKIILASFPCWVFNLPTSEGYPELSTRHHLLVASKLLEAPSLMEGSSDWPHFTQIRFLPFGQCFCQSNHLRTLKMAYLSACYPIQHHFWSNDSFYAKEMQYWSLPKNYLKFLWGSVEAGFYHPPVAAFTEWIACWT